MYIVLLVEQSINRALPLRWGSLFTYIMHTFLKSVYYFINTSIFKGLKDM